MVAVNDHARAESQDVVAQKHFESIQDHSLCRYRRLQDSYKRCGAGVDVWERWVSRSFWRLSLDEVIFFLGTDSRGARCSEPATFAFSAAWRLTE
jgi:hypothetical protein